MEAAKTKPQTIDEYIALFPEDTQKVLESVRQTIKEVAPEAQETISYAIPCFKFNGSYLVYFAGYKKHISVYPINDAAVEAFGEELARYRTGKGTAQFPLDKPVPLDLIKRVVEFMKAESAKKGKRK